MIELNPTEELGLRVARHLEDGALGFLGVSSGPHMLAFKIAQLTHCPHLGYIEKGGIYTPGRITLHGDVREGPPPVFERDLDGMIDLVDWRQSFMDVAMLGGIQVDQFGNTNMIAVGDYDQPTLRGPGTIGAGALAALVHEIHLMSERHDVRSLVETVDHCSGFGHQFAGRTRADVGLQTQGPVALHTSLCTFVFEDGRARLRQVRPGLTIEAIQERTGFEVIEASDGVVEVAPPTSDEVEAILHLRSQTQSLDPKESA